MALNVCSVCMVGVCVLLGFFGGGFFFPFFFFFWETPESLLNSLLASCVMLSSKTVPGCRLFFGVQCTHAHMIAWGFVFPLLFVFHLSFTYIIMDHYLLGDFLIPFNKGGD